MRESIRKSELSEFDLAVSNLNWWWFTSINIVRTIEVIEVFKVISFKALFEFIDVGLMLFIHRYSEKRLDIFQESFFFSIQLFQDLREFIGKDRSNMLISDVVRN